MQFIDLNDAPQETDPVILRITGPVAELVLNVPNRKNALSLDAWTSIPKLVAPLHQTMDVRVCIVRGGGGRSFCAGADISEFEAVRSRPDDADHYDLMNVRAFKALKEVPVPVVAAIEGPCLGGGLGVALACDLRISSDTAVFGIPAAKLGLAYPPDALADLLDVVSPSAAKKLLFSAQPVSAEAALQIGLIDEIVDSKGLSDRVNTLCQTYCTNAPLSLRAAKQAIDEISRNGVQSDLGSARKNARACIDSQDYAEGCRAFLDKRPPAFKGL